MLQLCYIADFQGLDAFQSIRLRNADFTRKLIIDGLGFAPNFPKQLLIISPNDQASHIRVASHRYIFPLIHKLLTVKYYNATNI